MTASLPEDTDMTPERWARLKKLFAAALNMPAAEREAFVQRECESDVEFAAELRSLLSLTSAASIPPIPPATFVNAFDDEFDDDDDIESILQKALGTDYESLRLI